LKGRVVREAFRNKKQAVLAVGFPTVDILHRDRPALEILDEACSDMASRLFLRIREEQGLAYYTGAFQLLGMAPGAFAFYLGTSPDQLDHAQAELLDEISKLERDGLADDELVRVKSSWLGKHQLNRQSPESVARGLALDELFGVGYDSPVLRRGAAGHRAGETGRDEGASNRRRMSAAQAGERPAVTRRTMASCRC
jgi:zinc protease